MHEYEKWYVYNLRNKKRETGGRIGRLFVVLNASMILMNRI